MEREPLKHFEDIDTDYQEETRIVRDYFSFLYQSGRNAESPAFQEKKNEFLGLCERAEFIPKLGEIIKLEKMQVLGLPNSLFLSEKAWEKFLERTKDYKVVFGGNSEFKKLVEEKKSLALEFEKILGPRRIADYDHYAFCYEGEDLICVIVFNVGKNALDISYSFSSEDKPGAGLYTLREIINNYDNPDTPRTTTVDTLKRPLGLGNIGFEYVDIPIRDKVDAKNHPFENFYSRKSQYQQDT